MNNIETSSSKTNVASTKNISAFLVVLSLILGLSLGILIATFFNSISNSAIKNETPASSIFDSAYIDEIYSKFQKEYIGELPNKDELTYGVVKGIISSLNDPYTYFLNPEESKSYLESRNPDFEGIGVTLKFANNNTEVETVLKGLPAEGKGIKNGDIILKVDNESVEGLTPSVVATKIRGKKGTTVKIETYRQTTSEQLTFEIVRDTIQVSNVNYKDLGNGIYKIDIVQFIDESVKEFNDSWDKTVSDVLSKNDARGIVIDLRNNPGGYVSSVKHVLEDFLVDNQVMMYEETKTSGRIEYRDYRKGRLENIPLIVLVNEGSASASEIFSAAIQDHNRGEVVGMPTVGKGVEQQVINDLPDNSMLVMVFQKWLTPNGRNITKDEPIKPDFEVQYKVEDFNNGNDTQLNKALEVLNQ